MKKSKRKLRQNWKASFDVTQSALIEQREITAHWMSRFDAEQKENDSLRDRLHMAHEKITYLEGDVLKQQAELARLKAIKHSCHNCGQTHGAECHAKEEKNVSMGTR